MRHSPLALEALFQKFTVSRWHVAQTGIFQKATKHLRKSDGFDSWNDYLPFIDRTVVDGLSMTVSQWNQQSFNDTTRTQGTWRWPNPNVLLPPATASGSRLVVVGMIVIAKLTLSLPMVHSESNKEATGNSGPGSPHHLVFSAYGLEYSYNG